MDGRQLGDRPYHLSTGQAHVPLRNGFDLYWVF